MDQLKPSVNTNTDSLVFPANENVCVAVGILAILAMIICPAWWKPRSTVSSVCDDRAQCKWWELFLLSKSLHSLGPAWPALRVFTSHLEMKHHHVFIIKHSHSHIATHEDVPRPNSDQITCRAWHFIWLKETQDLSKSFLLMSGTKCDLWFLNYILIYFFIWLAVSKLTPRRPSIIFAIVWWHLMRHILWGIISRSTTK